MSAVSTSSQQSILPSPLQASAFEQRIAESIHHSGKLRLPELKITSTTGTLGSYEIWSSQVKSILRTHSLAQVLEYPLEECIEQLALSIHNPYIVDSVVSNATKSILDKYQNLIAAPSVASRLSNSLDREHDHAVSFGPSSATATPIVSERDENDEQKHDASNSTTTSFHSTLPTSVPFHGEDATSSELPPIFATFKSLVESGVYSMHQIADLLRIAASVQQSISRCVFNLLQGCLRHVGFSDVKGKNAYRQDAFELWKKLQFRYGLPEHEIPTAMLQRLTTLPPTSPTTILDHLNEIDSIYSILEESNQPLSPALQQSFLINSLPIEFAEFKTSIRQQRMTYSQIVIELRLRYRDHKGASPQQSDALVATAPTNTDTTKEQNALIASLTKKVKTLEKKVQQNKSLTDKQRAERDKKRAEMKAQLSTEICSNFLKGKCKFKNKCYRQHPQQEEQAQFTSQVSTSVTLTDPSLPLWHTALMANPCPPKPNIQPLNLGQCLQATALYRDLKIIDSGASSHFDFVLEHFQTITRCAPFQIRVADNGLVTCHFTGTQLLRCRTGPNLGILELRSVAYIPEFRVNLISVKCLDEKGCRISFQGGRFDVHTKDNLHILTGSLQQNLYIADCTVIPTEDLNSLQAIVSSKLRLPSLAMTPYPVAPAVSLISNTQQMSADATLYHNRLGHVNHTLLNSLGNNPNVRDFKPINRREFPANCPPCAIGKSTRAPHGKQAVTKPLEVGEYVHSDTGGPTPGPSFSGNKYWLGFLEGKTRYSWVAFMSKKSDAKAALPNVLLKIALETKLPIQVLRTDNAPEFSTPELTSFYLRQGVKHIPIPPGRHADNGNIERLNRVLEERTVTMMAHANLTSDWEFWSECMQYANTIRNHLPTSGTNPPGQIPQVLLTGQPVSYSMFRVWGCDCFIVTPEATRRKLSPRAMPGMFMGLTDSGKAWRVFVPSTKHIRESADVVFAETTFTRPWQNIPTSALVQQDVAILAPPVDSEPVIHIPVVGPASIKYSTTSPTLDKDSILPERVRPVTAIFLDNSLDVTASAAPAIAAPPLSSSPSSSPPSTPDTTDESDLSETEENAPRYTEDSVGDTVFALLASKEDPQTYKQAMRSAHATEWKASMDLHLKALQEKGTYRLVPRPHDRSVISGKWVFQTKRDHLGNFVKHKTRFTPKGFLQRYGENFQETFAPTTASASIRLLISDAIYNNHTLEQFDVDDAFFYGSVGDDIIYVNLPEGYALPAEYVGQDMVMLLLKAIPGCKQSARCWWQEITKTMKHHQFMPNPYDPCVFTYHDDGGKCSAAVHVDDIVASSTSPEYSSRLVAALTSSYNIKCLGLLKWCLGIHIERTPHCARLTQTAYTQALLLKFGMHDCRPASTPIAHDVTLSSVPPTEIESYVAPDFPYRSAVGGLLWLAMMTRPDIAYAVSVCARHLHRPTNAHVTACKRIMQYLQGTPTLGISYFSKHAPNPPSLIPLHLTGTTDASWAPEPDTRRSQSAYVFTNAGGVVCHHTGREATNSQSSAEAEFKAISAGCREAIFLRRIHYTVAGLPQRQVMSLGTDSQSAIAIANNATQSSRSKHISNKHFYVRKCLARKQVSLHYVPTAELPADIFTKALTPAKFLACRDRIMAPPSCWTDNQ